MVKIDEGAFGEGLATRTKTQEALERVGGPMWGEVGKAKGKLSPRFVGERAWKAAKKASAGQESSKVSCNPVFGAVHAHART